MPQGVPQYAGVMNESNPPKRRGCFFYGCLSLVVLALLAVALGGIGFYVAKKTAARWINDYTETTPTLVEQLEYSEVELNALNRRLDEFKKALDPQIEDGAIGRFIVGLRGELKRAEGDQAEQLKIALAALDTSKEDSLLNQMRRDTQLAREQLLRAINPAAEGSPLAVIHQSLTERLERFAKSQKEQLEEAQQLSATFQRDIREAITRIEAPASPGS